jgi:hypothetical protein
LTATTHGLNEEAALLAKKLETLQQAQAKQQKQTQDFVLPKTVVYLFIYLFIY